MSYANSPDAPYRGWILSVLLGLDCLVNTILGGRFPDTISARLGRSIELGGWASRVPWPAWWVAHCKRAAS